MTLLQKIRLQLIALEKALVASSLLLLLMFALIQVIARNFFATGFAPLEVISRHLVLYVAFFGAALITEEQNHIKIDFLTHFITPKQKDMLVRPLGLLAAFICGIFTWYAGIFWLQEWQYTADQDRWITLLALILPLGFALLAVHFIFLAWIGPIRTGRNVA